MPFNPQQPAQRPQAQQPSFMGGGQAAQQQPYNMNLTRPAGGASPWAAAPGAQAQPYQQTNMGPTMGAQWQPASGQGVFAGGYQMGPQNVMRGQQQGQHPAFAGGPRSRGVAAFGPQPHQMQRRY